MHDAIYLIEKSRRLNSTFNATEIVFQARVKTEKLSPEILGSTLGIELEITKKLFHSIIQKATTELQPNDLARFCIISDSLDRPISTQLMMVKDITVEDLLSRVLKVLQSNKEIKIDENFTIDVVTVSRQRKHASDEQSGKGLRQVSDSNNAKHYAELPQVAFSQKHQKNKDLKGSDTNLTDAKFYSNIKNCDYCEQTFSSELQLKEHQRGNVHHMCSLTCKHCNHSFTRISNLNSHLANNICMKKKQMKQLVCEICHRSFKIHSNLARHLSKNVCTVEKSAVTCERCHKSFTRKHSLSYHLSKNVCLKRKNK